MTINSQASIPASLAAWPVALGIATVVGSLAAACMLPFVALAVLAAGTMSRGHAIATILAIWGVNQILGYTVMGYPQTAYSVGWGLALGAAALLAGLVARLVLKGRRDFAILPMIGAFAGAFVGYELLLFAYAQIVGGTDNFTTPIVMLILTNDALWFAGLGALYQVLTRTAPRVFGPAPALRMV